MSDEQYYLIDIRRNSAVEWKYTRHALDSIEVTFSDEFDLGTMDWASMFICTLYGYKYAIAYMLK